MDPCAASDSVTESRRSPVMTTCARGSGLCSSAVLMLLFSYLLASAFSGMTRRDSSVQALFTFPFDVPGPVPCASSMVREDHGRHVREIPVSLHEARGK